MVCYELARARIVVHTARVTTGCLTPFPRDRSTSLRRLLISGPAVVGAEDFHQVGGVLVSPEVQGGGGPCHRNCWPGKTP